MYQVPPRAERITERVVLRPRLRTVSLEEVVPSAVHALGTLHSNLVVDLPGDLAEVHTDPVLLERVLANLIGNALHWSPPDSVVRIQGHCTGDQVQLHVIDRGPGIPMAQRASVRQPFHRLGDSSTGGGLGLGLAIADRLVVAMAGALDLRDTPGGGLTAVVALPRADELGGTR